MKDNKTFEESLNELEKIASNLENGELGLDEATLHTLKIGGLFHDIGKIGVPDSVLLKEGKLIKRW